MGKRKILMKKSIVLCLTLAMLMAAVMSLTIMTSASEDVPVLDKYTVAFHLPNGDIWTRVADYQTPLEYFPQDPVKASTAEYDYIFKHWVVGSEDSEEVFSPHSLVTYTTDVYAVFESQKRSYTVTWMVDGQETKETYLYGETPTFKGSTDKASDAQYAYVFDGFDADIKAVKGDVTYTAQYAKTLQKYQVVFKDWNGQVLATVEVAYGEDAAAPSAPTRESDNTYNYTFAGWDSEAYKNVQANQEVTATYTSVELPVETLPAEIDTEQLTEVPETNATATETQPDVETDAPILSGGCDGDAIWIVIVAAVVLVAAVVILLVLRKKRMASEELLEEEIIEEIDEGLTELEVAPVVEEEKPREEIHYVEEVSAEEVDELMSDELAAEVLEESTQVGGSGKLGIINIGVLHDAFEAGDVVNLAVLKDKNMIDSNVGRLKVLASGLLDKPLTIEADAFSMQAIKMIILTGGHAVKLKNPDRS